MLTARIGAIRRAETVKAADANRLASEATAALTTAANANVAAKLSDAARELLVAVCDAKRKDVSERIETLVTRGLRAVFGREDYEFRFEWAEKRGVAVAEPVLYSGEGESRMSGDIIDGHGGGVVDVASFILRFVVSRSDPRLANVIVADEPFRHVSRDHAEGLGRLLGMLAAKAGTRFCIVTHNDALAEAADVVYEVRLKDGKSVVEKTR